jgi:hypothetical protein
VAQALAPPAKLLAPLACALLPMAMAYAPEAVLPRSEPNLSPSLHQDLPQAIGRQER